MLRAFVAALSCATGAACAAPSACDAPAGAVLEVGPGRPYATPGAAARAATDGATVRIAAGEYRGDVAVWNASRLTLCGIGGRARLHADGHAAQDKAIWVVYGSDVTIEGIEFHGARVPDRNGAGIRAQHGGRLLLRDSAFFDNENGLLGGNRADASIEIERCEFARNGHGDGQSHNLYVGQIARLDVRASFFHEARVGHNLKSRARVSRIETSYLMDGPTGTSSYLADFPEGGEVVLRGNLFHKGPQAENPSAIAFGAEGLRWPVNTLEMVHNTVVMTRPGGAFLKIAAATQSVRLDANLFAGTAKPALTVGAFDAERLQQSDNVVADAASLPSADDLAAPRFWPLPALRDRLRLPPGSATALRQDSPRPFVVRDADPAQRRVGALQAPP